MVKHEPHNKFFSLLYQTVNLFCVLQKCFMKVKVCWERQEWPFLHHIKKVIDVKDDHASQKKLTIPAHQSFLLFSGYGSQAVSSNTLSSDDSMSLRSISVDDTPDNNEEIINNPKMLYDQPQGLLSPPDVSLTSISPGEDEETDRTVTTTPSSATVTPCDMLVPTPCTSMITTGTTTSVTRRHRHKKSNNANRASYPPAAENNAPAATSTAGSTKTPKISSSSSHLLQSLSGTEGLQYTPNDTAIYFIFILLKI